MDKAFIGRYNRKYLMLPVGFIFLWFSIGFLVECSYDKTNLSHRRGQVNSIDILKGLHYSRRGHSYETRDLQISFKNDNEIYTIKSRYNYFKVINEITLGDTIDFYYKNELLNLFFTLNHFNIYELDDKEKVLFSYDQIKYESQTFCIAFFLASMAFIISWAYLKKKNWEIYPKREQLLK